MKAVALLVTTVILAGCIQSGPPGVLPVPPPPSGPPPGAFANPPPPPPQVAAPTYSQAYGGPRASSSLRYSSAPKPKAKCTQKRKVPVTDASGKTYYRTKKVKVC